MKKQKQRQYKKKHGFKKVIIGTVLILTIIIGAGLIFLLTNLNAIVKAAIQKYGSEVTQTAVRVDKVKISLKQGSGTILGITVANPKGFITLHAFSLGETGVKIDIRSLTGEVKIIDEIVVRGPKIFVEMNSEKVVNLNEIKKNLAQTASAKSKTPAQESEKGKEPKLIIRQLHFSEGTIFVKIVPQNNKEYQLNLPSLELNNLGGNSGGTPTQITRQILGELTRRALDEVKKKGVDLAVEKAQDMTKSILRDQKEKAGDKLGGLLGK